MDKAHLTGLVYDDVTLVGPCPALTATLSILQKPTLIALAWLKEASSLVYYIYL